MNSIKLVGLLLLSAHLVTYSALASSPCEKTFDPDSFIRGPEIQAGDPSTLTGRIVRKAVNKVLAPFLGVSQPRKAYVEALKDKGPEDFWTKFLKSMDMSVDVNSASVERIPESGGVLILANHPTGIMDGAVLASLVNRRRSDLKILMTDLTDMPGVEAQIIQVSIMQDTPQTRRVNAVAMRDASNWLKDGHVLIVFPGGSAAGIDTLSQEVALDPEWNDHFARIATKTEATVVPIFIHGQNDRLFLASGLIHPLLRSMQYARAASNLKGKQVAVEIGMPIPAKELSHFENSREQISYLRARTYALKNKRNQKNLRDESKFEPIALEGDRGVLNASIGVVAARPELVLAETEDLFVLSFSRQDLEKQEMVGAFRSILDEIGRLREITFRIEGEGSGLARDLDRFDEYYNHLIVWNKTKQELIGAYRVGFSDRIVQAHGLDGLYTRGQFKFDQAFFSEIGPALELGRSFVRPEYQGHASGIPMLFKGIGITMARNPQYKSFYGSVSISNAFDDLSKQIMMTYLMKNHSDSRLASLASNTHEPHLSPGLPKPQIDSLVASASDFKSLSRLISEIEPDGKGIPPLIDIYSTLKTRFLIFDFDHEFNTVDGLIVTNMESLVLENNPIVKRLMGREAFDQYKNARLELAKPAPTEIAQ